MLNLWFSEIRLKAAFTSILFLAEPLYNDANQTVHPSTHNTLLLGKHTVNPNVTWQR